MKTICLVLATTLLLTAHAHADTFGTGANRFDIDFVTIGDPGNPPGTTGEPNPAGSVDYVFRIGKFEVSRDMIEKASVAGGLGLTLFPMEFVTGVLGDGPRPNMPATGVSWNEAARFVNWLNTSEGFSPAYKFATQLGETGYNSNENIVLWEASDAGYDEDNLFRNSHARYFLPSVHEWYKAAYYDPDANGGAGGDWSRPTGSDSVPTPVTSGTFAGTAVWNQDLAQGPADITLAGGLSPYGVMGLGGNVFEWEETEWDFVNDTGSYPRGVRGGDWIRISHPSLFGLSALFRTNNAPMQESYGSLGFRVASKTLTDFNNDGTIDAADVGVLIGNRGSDGTGDINGDGIVDAADAGIMFGDWTGDSSKVASVPEPGMVVLPTLALCLLLMMHRRRLHP